MMKIYYFSSTEGENWALVYIQASVVLGISQEDIASHLGCQV